MNGTVPVDIGVIAGILESFVILAGIAVFALNKWKGKKNSKTPGVSTGVALDLQQLNQQVEEIKNGCIEKHRLLPPNPEAELYKVQARFENHVTESDRKFLTLTADIHTAMAQYVAIQKTLDLILAEMLKPHQGGQNG